MPVEFTRTLLPLLTLCMVAFGPAPLAAQAPPVVAGIRPLGGNPGVVTAITVTGTGLNGSRTLWTSAGGPYALSPAVENNGRMADRVVFDVAVPDDAPLGLQTLRVMGEQGVSTQRLWLVDDLPTVTQAEENLSVAATQSLSTPAAVDGVMGNLQRRFFRWTATEGQRVAMEVYARRVGSALDPLLVLYGSDGRQLATSDDTPGLNGDCQLVHHCGVAGDYVIELRDIRYRGGDDYPFRLRIGDFPCVHGAFPLAVQRAAAAELQFTGLDATAVHPVSLTADVTRVGEWLSVPARRADGVTAGFATLQLSDRPEVVEVEPNDAAGVATAVAWNENLNGRLQSSGDCDRFRYVAEKGQRGVWQGVARWAGSPADLQLRLLDASGKSLVTADDDGQNDARLQHTFAEAGEYTLEVTDLLHRGGPAFVYRIEAAVERPGFELQVTGDAWNVPRGGTAVLPVQLTRRGYNGAVALSVTGLPTGYAASPTIIGTGRSQGHLSITATSDAAASEPQKVAVLGVAEIDGQPIEVRADCTAWLREQWRQVAVVPLGARREFVLAAAAPAPFSLEIEPAEVVFGRHMTATCMVRARRTAGFDGEITLATLPEKDALPKEVAVQLAPIPAGADSVTVQFTAQEKAPLGQFSLGLMGTLKKDQATQTSPTPVVGLRLEPAYRLSVAGELAIPAGGEHRVTLQVQRNPACPGAATIRAQGLPEGVRLADVTLPADATEIELVFSATAGAAVGPVPDAKLLVTASDNDKLTVETPLRGLNVAASPLP